MVLTNSNLKWFSDLLCIFKQMFEVGRIRVDVANNVFGKVFQWPKECTVWQRIHQFCQQPFANIDCKPMEQNENIQFRSYVNILHFVTFRRRKESRKKVEQTKCMKVPILRKRFVFAPLEMYTVQNINLCFYLLVSFSRKACVLAMHIHIYSEAKET